MARKAPDASMPRLLRVKASVPGREGTRWLVPRSEVARELGLAPASITRYQSLQPLFPKPVITIGYELLWDESDIKQYKASGPHEWPGRKRGSNV